MTSQLDTGPSSELWRYGIEDLERLPFAGHGVWRSIGPAPLIVTGDQPAKASDPMPARWSTSPSIPPAETLSTSTSPHNGGVWKSVNGGGSWQPLTDLLPSSSIGAVAIDPGDPKIVYAGTGNLFDGSNGIPKATGLFKSVDGGITWAHMDGGLLASVFADHGINRIVCPAPNALFVACDIGLFFSKDGGVSFGANHPNYDDGQAVRGGFISSLIGDNNAIRQATHHECRRRWFDRHHRRGPRFSDRRSRLHRRCPAHPCRQRSVDHRSHR